MQKPSVSIVIPAYNEGGQLALCLDAIARQTVQPLEVIVVDNNSTDDTAAIASSYPFVTVVKELRQGLVYARTAGYNAVRGEIIGRIDADIIVDNDWVEKLQRYFDDNHTDVVVGSIGFYDVPFKSLFAKVELFCRNYLAKMLQPRRELYLYGGNMGMRRSAWLAVRGKVCSNQAFHEDQDLAAHFAHTKFNLRFKKDLHVRVSARRIDSSLKSYYPYVFANSRTFAAHGLRGRFYMYPIQIAMVILYVPLRLLYRAYDPTTGRLSLRRMFQSSGPARVSPVADSV